METADEQGIPMDFAIGANQGQEYRPSLERKDWPYTWYTYSNVTVAPGQTFKGTLPLTIQAANKRPSFMHHLEEFGEQTLIAVVAIEVLQDDSTAEGDYTEIDRIIDLTDKVAHGSRSLTWTAPKAAPGATWRIMGWYERFTNQRSIDGPSDAKTYLQNGSWIVDHFSAAGARIMDQFFDDHIVPEQSDRDLLASVGKYAWEDSMEMDSTLWWTRGFDKDFKRALGYDIRTCLPLLLIKENGWAQVQIAYDEEFYSKNMTRGEECNKDYRSVLQTKYEEYIQAHAEWARLKGLKFCNQPSYNLPLSMTESSPLLDAPEGESLGFFERIDAYKYLSGPAHFKKNPVISSELGAVRGMLSYSQTLSQVLWSFHRGLAGGVTMNVLHGYPYGGPFPNTTWPGVTIFNYLFPDMWGPRQPTWRVFPGLIEYMARNQYVLQAGAARVDLAMYIEDTPWTLATGYLSNNLQELGNTHDYIGSSLLASDLVTTKDEVLVPDGPAYKALVVYNQTTIDSRMANKLGKLAHAGLSIFFVGDLEYGQDIMKQIIKRGSPNIYSLASKDELPKALRDAGIVPNAAILNKNQAAGWYSVWRSTPEAEYIWFYSDGENNDTPVKTLNISFSHIANRTPVLLDAWSGQATPLHHFKRGKTDMVIPMTLGGNEMSIVAFVKDHGAKDPYVMDFTGLVKGFFSSAKKSKDAIFALVSNGAGTVTLSNGKECRFKRSVLKTTALNL
ncbi:uncharacterized protein FRV6_11672 [Fusarium oxysporum]|uniref:Uncharacterized protein n=1 Tax=Fusarium oxysporum TaxID=5507 RepID=A0A2H3TIN0_FUSOX|nr:uncharacterized protein FRV6_11672 [Fusarium oxysporum]